MLTKRIIPCLDIKNGRTVKGVNFVNLIDAGDPVVLAKQYAEIGAANSVWHVERIARKKVHLNRRQHDQYSYKYDARHYVVFSKQLH